MSRSLNREEVYNAFDSERDYQDFRWGGTRSSQKPSETESGSLDRTIDEFALYISDYGDRLKRVASSTDDPREKLEIIRKIGGLCTACGEKHGIPKREF